jgi:hypothetical protein
MTDNKTSENIDLSSSDTLYLYIHIYIHKYIYTDIHTYIYIHTGIYFGGKSFSGTHMNVQPPNYKTHFLVFHYIFVRIFHNLRTYFCIVCQLQITPRRAMSEKGRWFGTKFDAKVEQKLIIRRLNLRAQHIKIAFVIFSNNNTFFLIPFFSVI